MQQQAAQRSKSGAKGWRFKLCRRYRLRPLLRSAATQAQTSFACASTHRALATMLSLDRSAWPPSVAILPCSK